MLMKSELQLELNKLIKEESAFDNGLRQYFGSLADGLSSQSHPKAFDSLDLSSNVKKIEEFSPCFEAMINDSKKLANQVEDCRSLSDRLSIIVRRLDVMQIRAQQALACAEDVINLKEFKSKIAASMSQGNLPLAVSYIRQVHDVDLQAAKASDDYGAIQQAEREVRATVQDEFNKAIQESNINRVMSLCPLLQTLGLEDEARDAFLTFVEKTVFIAVSADASAVDDATDPATGYAQALSNVFNSTYMILQRYLPMVIQGMENSLGDVHFIRKLHAKCELESGLVLKRYMKFRHIKETITSMKATGTAARAVLPSEIHVVLDELALLIQYCCMYSKYIKQLAEGAEKRNRTGAVSLLVDATVSDTGAADATENHLSTSSTAVVGPPVSVTVFNGPTDFDKMVDELINRYYLEGEHWLMRSGVKSALSLSANGEQDGSSGSGLDECFFVLQKCSQRAIATNNVQAACAALHLISDLLSSDLWKQCSDMLIAVAVRIAPLMQEHMVKFTRAAGAESQTVSLSQGFQSALTLASSYTGTGAAQSGAGKGESALERGDEEERDRDHDEDDPYGMSGILHAFNTTESCGRYTDRLSKDIARSGEAVFGVTSAGGTLGSVVEKSSSSLGGKGGKAATTTGSSSLSSSSSSSSLSPEMDKLRICKEDFEAAKISFQQVLKQGVERVVQVAQGIMKDTLVCLLGRTGPLGGLRFDLEEDRFESQPAHALLPRLLVTPFEQLVVMCTGGLSEGNKDLMVGLLADACCERLEHFVSQTSFHFAGALKFEECVRALNAIYTRYSSVPIRGKFSRLREVMMALTCDVNTSQGVQADNFVHLTANEVLAFTSLRTDGE